eukprot:CAMPEP_0184042442 /NCGR_PEP_ID=MMETSP0955-20130417/66348_1 /TAXON_ID=627963 /ORGANISM="Aplanochytrium sp, Strain PBS07" /LENGTH=350 /DNA_ID=CAMNT_0026333201 /DNA_START=701 /DNA_END=1754 /DNA_ORIENTATION=-
MLSRLLVFATLLAAAVGSPTLFDRLPSSLRNLVSAAGLEDALKSDVSWTVLAPTNGAVNDLTNALGNEVSNTLTHPFNNDLLSYILLQHVLPKEYTSANIDGQKKTLLRGNKVRVYVDGESEPFVRSSRKEGEAFSSATLDLGNLNIEASNGIVHYINAVLLPKKADPMPATTLDLGNLNIEASNGIVHYINAVLLPKKLSPMPATVYDMLSEKGEFTILLSLIDSYNDVKSDLQSTTQESGITLFAPNDKAFNKLLGELTDEELADINLKKVLEYHYTDQALSRENIKRDFNNKELITMANGETVKTIGCIKFKTATNQYTKTTAHQRRAWNGYVHVLKDVMIPADTSK